MNRISIICVIFIVLNCSCNQVNVLTPGLTEVTYLEEFSHAERYEGSNAVIVEDSLVVSELRFSTPIDTLVESLKMIKIRSALISWSGDVGVLETLYFIVLVDGASAGEAILKIDESQEDVPVDFHIPDILGSMTLGIESMLLQNKNVPLSFKLFADNPLEDFNVSIDLRIQYSIITEACQEMPPGLDLLPCEL